MSVGDLIRFYHGAVPTRLRDYFANCCLLFFFFSSRRRHTRSLCDWSSDVCSSDLFLDFTLDEIHVEMASREFAEIELIRQISERHDVAVGVIDVKNYYVETPRDVADRVRLCLKHAPAEKLSFAPDCGLSQTARWAPRQKLQNMVAGGKLVRRQKGLC